LVIPLKHWITEYRCNQWKEVCSIIDFENSLNRLTIALSCSVNLIIIPKMKKELFIVSTLYTLLSLIKIIIKHS
jgi:hypothetical protein